MTADDEFTHRLIGFGLSEKEAQLYLHLLKNGPRTPSPLAKSLKTYREEVHRTLTSLIEKSLVRPSPDSPTVYAAVDLDIVLDSAVKEHESELREMERRKRELEELARQQQFRPSDEVSTFKILKTVKEIISTATPIIQSTEQEFLWIAPKSALLSASMFGINDVVQELTKRGGKTRGINRHFKRYDTARARGFRCR
jgi:sugar-specific transcriptional regulator TrmB